VPPDDELKTMPSSQRPDPPTVWLVSYADDDDRELAAPEIADALRRGDITPQTIVWTDGMSDWLPIADVPELSKLLPSSGETAGAPAVIAKGVEPASTTAESEPEAKRPSVKPPLPERRSSKPPAPAVSEPKPAEDAEPVSLVPESVHESGPESTPADAPRALGAGTFGAGAAPLIGDAEPGDAEGDEDIEPPPSSGTPTLHQLASLPPPNKSSIDDEILGLGGSDTGPMMAPPTIDISSLASDSPPEPAGDGAEERNTTPPVSEGASQFIPQNRGAPQPAAGRTSVLPWIVALVACGLAGWALLFRGGSGPEPSAEPPAPAAAPTPAAPTATAPATTEPTAEPSASAPEATPSASAAPSAGVEEEAPEAKEEKPEPEATVSTTKPEPTTKATSEATPQAAPTATATAQPTASAAPAPTSTASGTPAATATGESASAEPAEAVPLAGPFDRAAAAQALSAQAAAASSCRKEGDPSGRALVTVTFATSGRAVRATVDGPPFAGTATGGCIASTMRRAKVPAFSGERVTVTKTVHIN
jgi:hypothetical protein